MLGQAPYTHLNYGKIRLYIYLWLLIRVASSNPDSTTQLVIQTITEKLKDYSYVRNTTLYKIPLYWSGERRWTHYVGITKNFWLKYMKCHGMPLDWQGCEEYAKAVKQYHPNLEYMHNLEDDVNTNVEEQNPLKCHFNEIWTNITANSAIYSFYWWKGTDLSFNTLKVAGKYVTDIVGIDEEPEFSCSLGMNSSFVRSYIAPLIMQSWDVIGKRYNYSTKGFDIQEYEDIDYEDESTESTENTATSSTTLTPGSTATPRWDTIDKNRYSTPHPLKYGIPELPEPWGNLCPNSLKEIISKLGLPNFNESNWLCAAGTPNLPVYGNLSVIRKFNNEWKENKLITTQRTWNWDYWQRILQLGVEHWRIPIILTDLIPQPWSLGRKKPIPWFDCTQPLVTHICRLGNIQKNHTDNKGYKYQDHFAYICLPEHNKEGITWKIGTASSSSKPNLGPLYLNWTNGISNLYGMKGSRFMFAIQNSSGNLKSSIMGRGTFTFSDPVKVIMVTNTASCNISGHQVEWKKCEKDGLNCFKANYTAYSKNPKLISIRNITWSEPKAENLVTMEIPDSCQHSGHYLDGSDNTREDICFFHKSEIRNSLDFPIPWDIEVTEGNITLILFCGLDKNSKINCQNFSCRFISSLYGTRENHKFHCNSYNHTGIIQVNYTKPWIHMKTLLKLNSHLEDNQWEARYANNITEEGGFWKYLDMDLTKLIRFEHTGLPYYFNYLMPNPEYEEWNMVEWIAHKPKGTNKTTTGVWDYIYYTPIQLEEDNTPVILKRGNFSNNGENYGLFTAHYPPGYILPPKGNATVVEAPGLVPDLTSPAQVILKPVMRKVELTIDLNAFQPPNTYCDPERFTFDLGYSSPVKIGRKPLQAMAVAAFMAGAILGGIMGGGVSAAMIQPIKAEIYHLQAVNKETAKAISAISDGLDAMRILTHQMAAELDLIKGEYQELNTRTIELTQTNHALIMCNIFQSQIDKLSSELDTMFSTGLGRRTRTYQTIMDPSKESYCENGICKFHTYQIFLTNATKNAYHTISIPQKYHIRKGIARTEYEDTFTIPLGNYLWTSTNEGTPIYIPLEDTIQMGANTYVYPHMPKESLQTCPMAFTQVTNMVQNTGDYTFLVCTTENTNITCTNFNKCTLNDNIWTFNIGAGCYMVHNCSIINAHNQTQITKISTTVRTIWQGEWDMQSIRKHEREFEEKIESINKIAEFNSKQLESIHQQIKRQENALQGKMAEIHNLAHLIRTNTYIHKDWAKQIQQCSFWDYLARLARFNFICTPLYSWWQWMKYIFWCIGIGILVIILLCLRKIIIYPIYKLCCRNMIKQLNKHT